MSIEDRLRGVLLGTALGDALGLGVEGMSARAIARRFGRIDRFLLLAGRGVVSDDTEQSALVAQSLVRAPDDATACARAFRRSLLGWFARLPWGLGFATLRACVRIALGIRRSGVRSAGNGAAMRVAVIGVFFRDDADQRGRFVTAISEVTHIDPRAVAAARFVADVAAACARGDDVDAARAGVIAAKEAVTVADLRAALDRAIALAADPIDAADAAREIGVTGFVLHSVPLATFCLLRSRADLIPAITTAISAGGDTDTTGAIVGAWCGALHGASVLPRALATRLIGGPFGPDHLDALASALARSGQGNAEVPKYSALAALVRNLLLWPLVLGFAIWRRVPLRQG